MASSTMVTSRDHVWDVRANGHVTSRDKKCNFRDVSVFNIPLTIFIFNYLPTHRCSSYKTVHVLITQSGNASDHATRRFERIRKVSVTNSFTFVARITTPTPKPTWQSRRVLVVAEKRTIAEISANNNPRSQPRSRLIMRDPTLNCCRVRNNVLSMKRRSRGYGRRDRIQIERGTRSGAIGRAASDVDTYSIRWRMLNPRAAVFDSQVDRWSIGLAKQNQLP